MADVEQIENAVGEDDFFSGLAMLLDDAVQAFAGNNFFAGIHSMLLIRRGVVTQRGFEFRAGDGCGASFHDDDSAGVVG
jgi:hypothetical protein